MTEERKSESQHEQQPAGQELQQLKEVVCLLGRLQITADVVCNMQLHFRSRKHGNYQTKDSSVQSVLPHNTMAKLFICILIYLSPLLSSPLLVSSPRLLSFSSLLVSSPRLLPLQVDGV